MKVEPAQFIKCEERSLGEEVKGLLTWRPVMMALPFPEMEKADMSSQGEETHSASYA